MWAERVLRSVDRGDDLNPALGELFAQQRATWPALIEGETALRTTPVRVLQIGDTALVAQANVQRRASTFAKTDAQSIASRPCFLCEENLPAAERAVRFDRLVVMANPFPAMDEHLTIAAPAHVPQRLDDRVLDLHYLMRALGDKRFVLYNGPRCGASAPDHFHFQSGATRSMPIFRHAQLDHGSGVSALQAGARTAFKLRFADRDASCAALSALLARLPSDDGEPMVNVLAVHRDDHYVTLVFPRHKHRTAGFVPGGGGLAISPAGLEMAGLIVVSDLGQFERVDVAQVETIFEEVCWDLQQVESYL